MNTHFAELYGKWGIVAGASEGLGAAYARSLAEKGLNVVLLARRAPKLEALALQIRSTYGVEVIPIECDLASSSVLDKIKATTDDLEIGMLVYNAAYSVIGSFLKQSIEDHEKMVRVNCLTPAVLVHHFARIMKDRGRGGIILMSSLSGYQGSPLIASYASTKAYNRIMAESLWYELKEYKIDVIACSAGATSTPNYIHSKPAEVSKLSPPVLTPEEVVSQTLDALGKKPVVIPGFYNYLAANMMKRLLPTMSTIKIMGETTLKMYPDRK